MNKFEVIVLNSENQIVERHMRSTRKDAESLAGFIEENIVEGYSVEIIENDR
jgi:hypothetical protein